MKCDVGQTGQNCQIKPSLLKKGFYQLRGKKGGSNKWRLEPPLFVHFFFFKFWGNF